MKIRTDYSKPSLDIRKEEAKRIIDEKELVKKQNKAVSFLNKYPKRKNCLLCGKILKGQIFDHRGLNFIKCAECSHIQSEANPPKDYPFIPKTGYEYKSIYPRQTEEEYNDRKKRVYTPKLDWAVDCLKGFGIPLEKQKNLSWTEIGCGAGYFLSSLSDLGIKNYTGIDRDDNLVKFAQERLSQNKIKLSKKNAEEIVKENKSNIYVAFFVFEHLENSFTFWKSLKKLPKGTILIFSVPIFGFSCIIENIFRKNYARNLDGAVHTQLYTDKSIDYALNMSGFEKRAEWIFGQDAGDLLRILKSNLNKYPKEMTDLFSGKLTLSGDELQTALDHTRLADQRHMIAIKN
jgi:2-polyprenyl-3-methyl-5-hydroxy-6-metoxy-1,4-benzoquinol methylase